jgi:HNH endonuclease
MSRLNRSTRLRFVSEYNLEINQRGIAWGTCFCGCGQLTTISEGTDIKVFALIGHPRRYIRHHGSRFGGVEYVVEDRGYVTPCWIWQRGSSQSERGGRYGTTRKNVGDQIPISAHRMMWERHKGLPIPQNFELDHLCRQTICCNPDHLEPVSHEENVRRGVVSRSLNKLCADDVRTIIQLRKEGWRFKRIGKRFGVASTYVQQICYGQKWKGVVPDSKLPTVTKKFRGIGSHIGGR